MTKEKKRNQYNRNISILILAVFLTIVLSVILWYFYLKAILQQENNQSEIHNDKTESNTECTENMAICGNKNQHNYIVGSRKNVTNDNSIINVDQVPAINIKNEPLNYANNNSSSPTNTNNKKLKVKWDVAGEHDDEFKYRKKSNTDPILLILNSTNGGKNGDKE